MGHGKVYKTMTYIFLINVLITSVCVVPLHAYIFSYSYADRLLSLYENIMEKFTAKVHSDEFLLSNLLQYTNNLKFLLEAAENHTDVEEFVSNPIYAFKLIKCLTLDLEDLTQIFTKKNNQDFSNIMKETVATQNLEFPSIKDLRGVCQAILRLQDVYDLDENNILSGNFHDYWNGSLSDSDLRELRNCYKFHKRIELNDWLFSETEFDSYDDINDVMLLEYYRVIQHIGKVLHELITRSESENNKFRKITGAL